MLIRPISLLIALALITGCGALGGSEKQIIPHRGDLMAIGTGQLSFRAPSQGLASIYDVKSNMLIHTSAVGAGSVITINPPAGNITVTDADRSATQVVYTAIKLGREYEMTFLPTRAGEPLPRGTTQPY